MSGMMRALYIEDNENISLKDLPIPQPSKGQVAIKVEYAPINPFDKEILNGFRVGQKQLIGIVPGFEGAGTVIASGGGILGWKLKGNRVAFFTEHQFGSFGQYAIAEVNNCVELPNDVSFQDACCSFINPLSVLMMHQLIGNSPGIVSTGACSNLGRMLMRYCQQKGLHVLNIVKTLNEEKMLKDEGAKLILNINQDDFDEKLQLMSSSYGTTILFDAVGGEQLSRILNLMPNSSKVYLYANSSKQDLNGLFCANLMYQNKKIFGFSFLDTLGTKNLVQMQLMLKEVINNINGIFKTLPTHVVRIYLIKFQIEEFDKALESKEKAILKL